MAYLGRTPGWAALVGAAGAHLDRAGEATVASHSAQELEAARADLAAAHEHGREEIAGLTAQLRTARAELDVLTRALREEKGARRRAERAVTATEGAAAQVRAASAEAVQAAEADQRAARARQAEAETALGAARKADRDGRSLGDTRLRLLLDTVVEAAAGHRRELALPPPGERPADLVDAARPGDELAAAPERALRSDDPALLDHLLGMPQVHLVVDGYNVTMAGFPDLPLEGQRSRLVTGLAALAAQSGAEITCCFDGADVLGRVPASSARGVRVLFSTPGEIADELIRRLVRAEPVGRPVVVVSSDREVVDGVGRAGADGVREQPSCGGWTAVEQLCPAPSVTSLEKG